jgi:uncharacterized protein YjbI with pentapeptide repeats
MVSREQSTQTKQGFSQYCNCSRRIIKNAFKFLAILLLPLTLGIFTIVITFHQQKVAEQQWAEHRSDSRLERELDWNISKSNQEAQNIVVRDQYRDQVFVAYFKEMGDLLEKNRNGSFTSDGLMAAIARVKTLNTFRQLDGSRQTHIIRFLYEAELLTNTNESVALDISTAELTDIDFRKLGRLLYTGQVSLAGVNLKNCILNSTLVNFVNFSFAEIEHVNFSSARLCDVNFTLADLEDVNFSSVYLEKVNFSSATLYKVNFTSAEFINVNFSSAKFCKNV